MHKFEETNEWASERMWEGERSLDWFLFKFRKLKITLFNFVCGLMPDFLSASRAKEPKRKWKETNSICGLFCKVIAIVSRSMFPLHFGVSFFFVPAVNTRTNSQMDGFAKSTFHKITNKFFKLMRFTRTWMICRIHFECITCAHALYLARSVAFLNRVRSIRRLHTKSFRLAFDFTAHIFENE